MKPSEVVAEVLQLADDLELARGILIAMVRAKRAGEAAPDAWAAAFSAVDRWTADDGTAAPVTTVRCGECAAVLQNMSTVEPTRIHCGPVHVLYYADFSVEIGEGTATLHPNVCGVTSIVALDPCLEDEGSEGDAVVPD